MKRKLHDAFLDEAISEELAKNKDLSKILDDAISKKIDEDIDGKFKNFFINKKYLSSEKKKLLHSDFNQYFDFKEAEKIFSDYQNNILTEDEFENQSKKLQNEAVTKYFNNLRDELESKESSITEKDKKNKIKFNDIPEKYEGFEYSRTFGLSTKRRKSTRKRSKSKRRKSTKKRSKSKRRKSTKKRSIRRKSVKKSHSTKKDYTIQDKYFKGELKLFSKDYCGYCQDLKKMLGELNVKFEEIEKDEANKYGIKSGTLKADEKFQTVPQLFSVMNGEIFYLGGHNDTKDRIADLKKYKK